MSVKFTRTALWRVNAPWLPQDLRSNAFLEIAHLCNPDDHVNNLIAISFAYVTLMWQYKNNFEVIEGGMKTLAGIVKAIFSIISSFGMVGIRYSALTRCDFPYVEPA